MKGVPNTNSYTVQNTQSLGTFKIQMPTKSHFNNSRNKASEKEQDRFQAGKHEVLAMSFASEKLRELCKQITENSQIALIDQENHVTSTWLHEVFECFDCHDNVT